VEYRPCFSTLSERIKKDKRIKKTTFMQDNGKSFAE